MSDNPRDVDDVGRGLVSVDPAPREQSGSTPGSKTQFATSAVQEVLACLEDPRLSDKDRVIAASNTARVWLSSLPVDREPPEDLSSPAESNSTTTTREQPADEQAVKLTEAAIPGIMQVFGCDHATAWNALYPPNGALGPVLADLTANQLTPQEAEAVVGSRPHTILPRVWYGRREKGLAKLRHRAKEGAQNG